MYIFHSSAQGGFVTCAGWFVLVANLLIAGMPSGEVQTMFRDKDPLVLHPIVCTNLEDYDKSIANYNNNLDWDVAFTPEAELIYDQITTVIGPPIRRGGRPSKH